MRLTDTDKRALQVLRVRRTFTELRAVLGISDTAHRRGRVLDSHLQAMVREGLVDARRDQGETSARTYQTTADGARQLASVVARERRRRVSKSDPGPTDW